MLTTKMHRCLEVDEILYTILLKLPLRPKFTALAVSRKWRQKTVILLGQHNSVVLSCNTPDDFYNRYQCKNHPATLDNVITHELYHTDFWKAVLSFLPGIEYVYLDLTPNRATEVPYFIYKDLLQHVIDKYGSQLKCLWIPQHQEDEGKEEEFLAIDSLPELRDLHFTWIMHDNVRRILTICPKLEYLECYTEITEWNLLPKGFKRLNGSTFQGLNTLLLSPAAQSIEEMQVMQLTSEAVLSNFWLPCLKVLHVDINETPNDCLNPLARIIRFSPVLSELSVTIESMQEMEGASWSRVIEECTRVTHFKLQINACDFNVNSWQDDFSCSMALNMKNLKHFDVGFALSSTGLTALSSLPQLEFFRHKLHQEIGVKDTVFNEDALYSFLKIQLQRNLSHYQIGIPNRIDGSYLTVTQEFADRLIIMAQDLLLIITLGTRVRGSRLEYQRMRQPGMVYVTELKIFKHHQ